MNLQSLHKKMSNSKVCRQPQGKQRYDTHAFPHSSAGLASQVKAQDGLSVKGAVEDDFRFMGVMRPKLFSTTAKEKHPYVTCSNVALGGRCADLASALANRPNCANLRGQAAQQRTARSGRAALLLGSAMSMFACVSVSAGTVVRVTHWRGLGTHDAQHTSGTRRTRCT